MSVGSGGWIGRPLPRLEDPRLLRGEGTFTDDFVLPGQTYAAFVRSPHAHARVVAIDVAAARSLPGVIAVLTGVDYVSDGGRGIAHAPVPADVLDYRTPAFDNALDEPHLPLTVDEVRYAGEAVAMVMAESAALARDAVELVAVEYEVLPAVIDVRAGWPGVEADFGDRAAAQRAIAEAEVVVERELRVQRVANAQLEPRAAIGSFDPDQQTFQLIVGSQGALRQRTGLAAALGVPPERVRVITPDVGGGFGPRTSVYPEHVAVTWAARRIGRPVRWTSTRAEAFLTDFQGRECIAYARLALDRGGRIRALAVVFSFNIGGRTNSYVPLSNAARILTSVYDIPLATARVRGVLTHTVPTGPYRGAGRPEAIFVLERMLDLAAEELGLDRVEIRRRNLVRADQLPYRSAMGLTYDSGDFVGNMDHALALAEWHSFDRRRTAAAERGKLAGIGLANYVEAPVGAPHERVEVTVHPHGQIELTVGTQSTGQGHATSFAQVLAHELGVEPRCIRLLTGDTEVAKAGGGTHSDRSMRLVGSLLVEAAADVRAQVAQASAEVGRELDVFEAADVVALKAQASFTGRLPAHPTGCAVCEVEVDPETGHVQVTGYTSVDDIGQPINRLIAHGQVHGGIVHGLGQALCERVVFEPASGQLLSGSFADYAMPTAAGLPWFVATFTEDPTSSNPLRVKGGGESGITPALACVVNAVADALAPLGIAALEMPLMPNRVWESLR